MDEYLKKEEEYPLLWYYTPMMLPFSRHVRTSCRAYDCMDELANFKFAPSELAILEQELLRLADIVFTGGYSLYEAKRGKHVNIHAMPSSVDRAHFEKARAPQPLPEDLLAAPGPRLGFYGVIDERMDLSLLSAVANARPGWTFVMVGPVVKIDLADLPQRPNILYLGAKPYHELPVYLAAWDVAIMPFAINESTRFISPTKTPEYLAAGRPVVSTPIVDVVRHYGDLQGVFIADTPEHFIAACEAGIELQAGGGEWLRQADELLAQTSWSRTFRRMDQLIHDVGAKRRPTLQKSDETEPSPGLSRRQSGSRALTDSNVD